MAFVRRYSCPSWTCCSRRIRTPSPNWCFARRPTQSHYHPQVTNQDKCSNLSQGQTGPVQESNSRKKWTCFQKCSRWMDTHMQSQPGYSTKNKPPPHKCRGWWTEAAGAALRQRSRRCWSTMKLQNILRLPAPNVQFITDQCPLPD